jgi:hypothetical protein
MTSIGITTTPRLMGDGVIVGVVVCLGERIEINFWKWIRLAMWRGAVRVDDGGRRRRRCATLLSIATAGAGEKA